MTTHAGKKYIVAFIDDLLRSACVLLMRHKSEMFYFFQEYKQLMENKLNIKVKTLHSDHGG